MVATDIHRSAIVTDLLYRQYYGVYLVTQNAIRPDATKVWFTRMKGRHLSQSYRMR